MTAIALTIGLAVVTVVFLLSSDARTQRRK